MLSCVFSRVFSISTSFSTMSSDFSASNYNSEASESSNDLCELLPLEEAKSTVWEYFCFLAENDKFTEKDNNQEKE